MTNDLPVEEADLLPIAASRYIWRWTDPRYRVLPAEALATIRPLTVAKARDIYRRGVEFSGVTSFEGEIYLSPAVFPHITRADTSDNVEEVRLWLEMQVPDASLLVFVAWDPADVVLVNWQVFCKYWDDFCYPSSDNNLIWPASEDWALFYWHEEEFIFGAKDIAPR